MTDDKIRILLLKGCAGLGNRIFTLLEAIHYAEKTNRHLVIDWGDDLYFQKGYNFFDDFFKLDNTNYSTLKPDHVIFSYSGLTCYPTSFQNNFSHAIYDDYTQVHNPLLTKIAQRFKLRGKLGSHWMSLQFYHRINKLNIIRYFISARRESSFEIGENLKYGHNENVVIFADYTPKFRKDIFLAKFRLNEKMNDLLISHPLYPKMKEAIGVHIRFTDLKPKKEIEKFILFLKETHRDQTIFLATDSDYIVTIFKNNFNKLIQNQKDFRPDQTAIHKLIRTNNNHAQSVKDLENSLFDLYFLGNCKTLYYQGNSSFSILASALNKNQSLDWQNLDI